MTKKILILPGDGIGPEIIAQAEKVLAFLINKRGFDLELDHGLLGGCAVDAAGSPFPDETLKKAKSSAAILLGAVGGPKWESIERSLRPERGLLAIRSSLELYANLRPAVLFPQLAMASTLKEEVVSNLDICLSESLPEASILVSRVV